MEPPQRGEAARGGGGDVLSWLLSVRSEECATDAAEARIRSIFNFNPVELAPRLLHFRAPEKDLAAVVGLEVFGSLSLVVGEAQGECIDVLKAALEKACVGASGGSENGWPMGAVKQYRAWRGKEALSNAPAFKIFFRSLCTSSPDARHLQAAVQAALSARGWRAQLSDPDLSIILLLASSSSLLLTLELRPRGTIASATMRPDLNGPLSEEYVKSCRGELRRLQRSKKKKLDIQTHTPPLSVAGPSTSFPSPSAPSTEEAPRRLMRAEAILQSRTDRIIVILERSSDEHNQYAILRTAEAMGVQHVWFILHPAHAAWFHINRKITKKKEEFLTLRTFDTTSECIAAAKSLGAELWATDLAPGALPLLPETMHKLSAAFPRKVALVLGAESIGISDEMRSAAHIRLYLPIYGFSDSLNVSVAAALVLQRLFDMCPTARGQMSDEERQSLRVQWYKQLASTPVQEQLFASYISRPPPPLSDLRREGEGGVWLPPKIAERDNKR